MIRTLALRSSARGRPRPKTFSRRLKALGRPLAGFGCGRGLSASSPAGAAVRASLAAVIVGESDGDLMGDGVNIAASSIASASTWATAT
jgi:hypothetical protein